MSRDKRVLSDLVGAQPVLRARRREGVQEVGGVRRVRRQQRREDRQQDEAHEDRARQREQPAATERPQPRHPAGLGLDPDEDAHRAPRPAVTRGSMNG